MAVGYREEPCRCALNRVKGMPFGWSLNPYMGCVHRCTFCYVRAFERRADRPSDDRYGSSIRVKTNVVEVLRRELARASWRKENVAIGAATDPYQPAEGRYRLTRACIEALSAARSPFSIITRGPLDRARRRRARGGLPPYGRLCHASRFRPSTARSGAGPSRAPPAAAAAAGADDARRRRDQGERRDGADPARPQRPAGAARRRRTRGARGRRDRRSGRTCSTCGPERASTSSSASRATGPSCYPSTSACTPAAPTCRPPRRSRRGPK